MTSMTINGCSTTTALGSEQYESFTCKKGMALKEIKVILTGGCFDTLHKS